MSLPQQCWPWQDCPPPRTPEPVWPQHNHATWLCLICLTPPILPHNWELPRKGPVMSQHRPVQGTCLANMSLTGTSVKYILQDASGCKGQKPNLDEFKQEEKCSGWCQGGGSIAELGSLGSGPFPLFTWFLPFADKLSQWALSRVHPGLSLPA